MLSKKLADFSLHEDDLAFAAGCLKEINNIPKQNLIVRQALWRSSAIHFMKCFGKNAARSQLHANKIFKGDATALVIFKYFSDLRDKHFIHDENSYTQSLPGAILNKSDKRHKIEKIVCLNTTANTLTQTNYNNLGLLIQKTHSWVIREFDNLCDKITKELEIKSYDDLHNREGVTYKAPGIDEIDKNRINN